MERGGYILLVAFNAVVALSPPHSPFVDTLAGISLGISLACLTLSFARPAK